MFLTSITFKQVNLLAYQQMLLLLMDLTTLVNTSDLFTNKVINTNHIDSSDQSCIKTPQQN